MRSAINVIGDEISKLYSAEYRDIQNVRLKEKQLIAHEIYQKADVNKVSILYKLVNKSYSPEARISILCARLYDEISHNGANSE